MTPGSLLYRGGSDLVPPADLVDVMHEVPRELVAGAEVHRHRMRPGRLRVTFVDGSWLAYAEGWSRQHGHLRICTALTSP